jgi:hypothetical protein
METLQVDRNFDEAEEGKPVLLSVDPRRALAKGPIYECTADTVSGKPHIRVAEVGSDRARLYPTEDYCARIKEVDKVKGYVPAILNEWEGYLYSNDREDFAVMASTPSTEVVADSIFMGENSRFNPVHLNLTLGRARKLKRLGVPPIFKPELETTHFYTDPKNGVEYHTFPAVDTAINMFARNPRHGYHYRSNVDNILHFAKFGVGGGIAEAITRELQEKTARLYTFDSDQSQLFVMGEIEKIVASLREDLKGIAPADLREFNGRDVMETVETPFWYSQFAPNSIGEVLKEFWTQYEDGLAFTNHAGDSIKGSARKVARLFPGHTPESSGMAGRVALTRSGRADERIFDKAANGNLAEISSRDYKYSSDTGKGLFEDALVDYFSTFEPSKFNGDWKEGLPNFTGSAGVYHTAVQKGHIKAMERMNDASLIEHICVTNKFGRAISKIYPDVNDYATARVRSNDFVVSLTDTMRERFTLEDLASRDVRREVGIMGRIFDKDMGWEIVDGLYRGMVGELSDGEFVDFFNGHMLPTDTKPMTRELILSRAEALVRPHVKAGTSFVTALGKVGIKKDLSSLRERVRKAINSETVSE